MQQILSTHRLSNGLVLLAEEMNWCESVAYTMLVPCGAIDDPPERPGLANLVCEMVLRGAGDYDNRRLSEAFENLGSERSESVSQAHTAYAAQSLAEHLYPTLELLADLVLRPHLPEDQLEAARQVALQEILSLEDEPPQKMMVELGRNFFPDPWGRPSFGEFNGVERITIEEIRRFYSRYYQPEGAILSVAGKFDIGELRADIERLFGDWKANSRPPIVESDRGTDQVHIPCDSAQTHIGIAYPAVPFRDPDFLPAWSGVNVLSGGMSGRLFEEIREKRGLCYSVSASYYTHLNRGSVFCYCGTAPARAQESLDLLFSELDRLREGIGEGELRRLKIRAKCSLIMQQESTAARSSAIARDWYHLGRVRTKAEIDKTITELTRERINDYLRSHPAGPFHIVTLGKENLKTGSQG